MEKLLWSGGGGVVVEDDEVSEKAGFEATFLVFAELGEGGGLGVGVDGLLDGDLLLKLIGFGAGFVLPVDRGVEASEGIDGFDGVVGAKGQSYLVIEERTPRIGVPGSVGAEAVGGPVHVGEEMAGLHGGDDAFAGEAIEVCGEEHLGVFDAEAEAGGIYG